ncbi:MAG TPA: hypothetical protein VL961_09110, partial [Acidimicrobiales bacterium]|nr:hypothetical protein [Acidimicrobiales bacterium]
MRVPSVRSTYGLLTLCGSLMLAAGLSIPFLVGSPAPSVALSPGGGSGLLGLGSKTNDVPSTTTPATLLPPASAATSTTTTAAPPTSGTTAGGAPVAHGAGPAASTGAVAAPSAAPSDLTASDVGVTPTTIKVGIPVPELSNLGQLGATEGDPQLQWEAYIDNLNAHGGILGRQVVPVFTQIDLTNADSMEQACIYLTEQADVFAVLQ